MVYFKSIDKDGNECFFNSKEQLDRFLTNNKKKTYSVFWKDMSTEYNWGWKPLHIAKEY